MKVVASLDPRALERELLARVEQAHASDRADRTLVIVPTAVLARHVRGRLTEVRPAWLGVEVMHFHGLARAILAEAGRGGRVVPLSSRLLDALLERVRRENPDNLWSRFVARRPGAAQRLRSALDDLREAGLEPGTVARHAGPSPKDAALAELYGDYWRLLEVDRQPRFSDEAGLVREAVRSAAAYGERCRAVFLHGAYEVIGVHLDLLRELDRTAGVTALVPFEPGARVSAYAEAFVAGFLEPDEPPETVDASGSPPLAALFDEDSRPPAAPDRFAFRHVQGEAAEVQIALREALAAIGDGGSPSEIVLTARSLGPYASAIEQALDDEDLPWFSSLETPLRRQPVVRDFLLLLEVLDEGLPRRATAELLRSPRLRWERLVRGGRRPRGDRAELWSRKARILGGLDEWRDGLLRWAEQPVYYRGQGEEERAEARETAERRAEEVRRIAEALEALEQRASPAARRWSEHATRLADLRRGLFEAEDGMESAAAQEALEALLEDMRRLEERVGDRRPVPFAEMRRWLEDAVSGETLRLHGRDRGGIRVLDAMQLRGVTCSRVYVLGLNAGLLPRAPREDPVLTDGLRRRLREETGRPLPVKAAAEQEERLLLALTLGAARDRVEVSWQRADESGRAKTPSLALREIARLARGAPDLEGLRQDARHLRSHPTQWLEDLAERPGLISPDERVLLEALRTRGVTDAGPELADGMAMLRATQAFHVVDAAYDGRVGARAEPDDLSVSAIETLGRCPLQYFFGRVLRVRELDPPAEPLQIEPRELGVQVHDALERIYATLADEGCFDRGPTDLLIARALALLDGHRDSLLGPTGERLSRRVPVLFEQLVSSWRDALAEFLRVDLSRLSKDGLRPLGLEQDRAERLEFGGATVRVRGRFDRTLTGADGTLVGDYKTSGNLKDRISVTRMLKGDALQVPLYALLAGEGATVELLGTGPGFDYDGAGHRFVFSGFGNPRQDRGFRETVGVLMALLRAGRFPLKSGTYCRWCTYEKACRRSHPPTIDRESLTADTADFRLLAKKAAKKPELGDLEPRS